MHLTILLAGWVVAPALSSLLAGSVTPADPEMQIVRFRFNEITADVSEASRVDAAPDTDILGRFDSRARDLVQDDRDTAVPLGGEIGPDNSIPGTGADADAPGGGGEERLAERRSPAALEQLGDLRPGLRDALPRSEEFVLTGRRRNPQRPGYGARRMEGLGEAGALDFGEYAFSTRAWDYEPYWHHMRAKLYAAWHPPAAYTPYGILQGGWTLVRAIIDRDGKIVEAEVLETHGHESLHQASKAAMIGAAPFRKLPAGFPDENLVVTVRFIYLPPGQRPARDVP
ncbi:MAG: energy transducer TonB [Candidatus Krumholzibacteriia bacterium]